MKICSSPRLILLVSVFLLISGHLAKSQTASEYIFSATTSTYSAISGGSIVSNNTTHDDEFFSNQNIGFSFNYLGTDYTQMGVSINGYITLGTGGSNTLTPIASQNLTLSALGTDILAQTGAELRMQTIGTTPNRVCVIQWAGYRHYNITANYNFQIRLYETSNIIEFHYGSFTHGNSDRTTQVGLRGSAGTDFNNRSLTSTAIWSTSNTSAGTGNTSTLTLRQAAYPSNGLVFSYIVNADLGLTLAVDQNNLCLGSSLNYTIEVSSAGPASTQNVSIASAVPSGLTFVSAVASQGSYNSGTGIWDVGTVNNDGSANLVITATVNNDQGGNIISSSASISGSSLDDPETGNNSSSLDINILNNTLPTLSTITNKTAPYNGSSDAIDFTIGDTETDSNDLVIDISSSNTTCIPLAGIDLGGTGINRSLTISPGLNQSGNSDITIELSDGVCATSTSFNIEVFKQTYSTFESANIVVGQENFTSVNTTASQIIAPGSNSSAVSVKGVLAVGSQTRNRVLIWNSVPTSNGAAANLVLGQTDFTTFGSAISSSGLSAPDGVTFSPDGNKLIVADAGNDRVLIWNTIPTSNNQAADVVIGSSNFTTNNTGTTANRLSRPTDVLITPDGKMLITDRDNNRVLIFNKIPTTNGASADVVIGQSDFVSGTAATSASRLRTPWNCSLAPDGKLLIADDGNNRILVFNTIPTTNGASANVVIGQVNFTDMDGGSGDNKFTYPGVSVSPTGVVAIADFDNHRVLVYNEIPASNGASADLVLGQADFTQVVSYNDGAGNSATPSDKNMSEPYGINFDLNERLFVNGRDMNRLMVFGETPSQVSDLALSFSGDDGSPCVGGFVSYTINITNNGPNNATNIVVTSALPSGFTASESNVSSGTYNTTSGYWSIPYIANGETVSLEMIGSVNSGQGGSSITTYASVRSYNQADNNFSNNAGSVTVSVENNVTPTISAISNVITDYNTSTGNLAFTIADTESAVNDLVVTATSSNTTIVPNGNIVLAGTGANRTINVTPALNQTGTVTITIQVSDGLCTTSLSFDVSCGNVWLGHTSDWNTLSNWSAFDGVGTPNVYIPASPIGGNFPIANTDVTVANLTIEVDAMITINATRLLTIEGNFLNSGNSSTGNGTLVLAGSTAQTFSGVSGSVDMNNVNGVTLVGNTNIQGTLTLTSGNLTVGSNTLTLRNPVGGTLASLVTNGNSSISIEGTAAGITLPTASTSLSNLSLNNASGLTINADLSIGNILTLINGSLRLNGNDLTLNGTVNTSNGTISSTNASNISISGTGAAGTIAFTSSSNEVNNFTMNKTASGSLNLGSNAVVSGVLNMIAGNIITGSHKMIVENTAANAMSNYGVGSYIQGNLKRCVVEAETYDFPVGSANNYELATITFNSISESTCMDAMFTEGLSGTVPSDLTDGGTAIDGLLNHGFWTIKNDNLSAVINYNVTLTSRGHSNGGPTPARHTILKRDNAASAWIVPGAYSTLSQNGSDSDPITSTRTSITGFSDMGIGVSSEGELPMELVYFKANRLGSANLLSWQTASETNNDYFEIERGTSVDNMATITKIEGSGTTYQNANYRFEDKTAPEGTIYYRLKQTDFDGRFAYSNMLRLSSEITSNQVHTYPNPIQSGTFLSIEMPSMEEIPVLVEMRDANGNTLQSWNLNSSVLNTTPLLLPKVAQGIYIISIITDKEKVDKRIVVR